MARRATERSDPVQLVSWDQLWTRLLTPPRPEPGTPEPIPTPEQLANPEPRSRSEGDQQ